jgi:opacity protein-like surface antigen
MMMLVASPCLQAQTANPADRPDSTLAAQAPDPSVYWENRGRWTFGFQLAYGLQNAVPRNISHINMLIAQPQLGLIAWDSPHARLPVKRFEILSEGILGSAFHPGGRLLGHTLLLRFDFQAVRHVVPYFDAGIGALNTTVAIRAPELTGQTQFLSQGGVGIQYFFRPQRALVLEYRYFHMSNAGLQEPNHGINGNMLSIGFRWLLRPNAPGWKTAGISRNFLRRVLGRK